MSARRLLFVSLVVLTACTDVAQPRGPGTFTATLQGPNGDEGAAVLSLVGEGILEVTALGDTELYAVTSEGVARVVLINQSGGTLAFDIDVADLGRSLAALVLEVAGPDDQLRSDLSEYRVELSR